ncbi:class II aldolase/adducin family protein [Roseibium sediminis]|uniref:class II aldolase/adducin family protein n=1 Tax=Roseibium sediminis TaxID=1775174 RepID=UPI0013754D27|nr:class II aldolase/adducin family protein [Roseibium sediminis]
MSIFRDLKNSTEFQALIETSARLGSNPLQVQGAGGNTSLESDGAMWVKASGTWLADAQAKEIFVPIHSTRMMDALCSGDPKAGNVLNFTEQSENASGLRASIETSVHSAIPAKVVLHTHCVATIAAAVRSDAESFIAGKLDLESTTFIPYVKPGNDLSHAIRKALTPKTNILVLGNHGLVACGETVAEAEARLLAASRALEPETATPERQPADGFAAELAAFGWEPVPYGLTQAIAFDDWLLSLADGATLYPDHLVFLGPGAYVARLDESIETAIGSATNRQFPLRLVVMPGKGVATPQGSSASQLALARAFGDVLTRVERDVAVNRLTEAQEAELLDWDAEKLRQALDKSRATA